MTGRRREPDTADLAELPVDRLPPDAPDEAVAAVDEAPSGQPLDRLAHDPGAERGSRAVLEGYATALTDGLPRAAADLFAEHAGLYTGDGQVNGRDEIERWHQRLLRRGALAARPAGQGNDAARLDVRGASGAYVVELSFDASGRIGSARWLRPEAASIPQEERTRRAL